VITSDATIIVPIETSALQCESTDIQRAIHTERHTRGNNAVRSRFVALGLCLGRCHDIIRRSDGQRDNHIGERGGNLDLIYAR